MRTHRQAISPRWRRPCVNLSEVPGSVANAFNKLIIFSYLKDVPCRTIRRTRQQGVRSRTTRLCGACGWAARMLPRRSTFAMLTACELLARARVLTGPARCIDADEMVQSVFGSFFRERRTVFTTCRGRGVVEAVSRDREQDPSRRGHLRAAKRDIRMKADGALLETWPTRAGRRHSHASLELSIKDALDGLPPEHRRWSNCESKVTGWKRSPSGSSDRSVPWKGCCRECERNLPHFVDEA